MTLLTDEQLANIAHDYFLSQMNIADISEKYNLSRYLITKSLEDARNKGIVKISIAQTPKRSQKLESEFRKQFNLKEVYILEDLETKNQNNEVIVSYAAKQIQNYTKSAHVVGLTWGALLREVINDFSEANREDLTFVQLLGQAVNAGKRKNQLVQDAADKFNAKCLTFPAPLYSVNTSTVTELKKEPFYVHAEEMFDQLDMVCASLGTMQSLESNEFFMDNYAKSVLQNVDSHQVAGIVFGRPYDINGNFYKPIEPHICGINLDTLMQVPNRFIIVKNHFKEDALLGALRGDMITHLITNSGIAEQVLRKNKSFS